MKRKNGIFVCIFLSFGFIRNNIIYIYTLQFFIFISIFFFYHILLFVRKKSLFCNIKQLLLFFSALFQQHNFPKIYLFILLGYYFVVVMFMVSIHRANLNYLYIVCNYNNTFYIRTQFYPFYILFFLFFLPLFIHRPIRNILTWKSLFLFFYFYHFIFFLFFYYYSTFLFPMSALPVLFP